MTFGPNSPDALGWDSTNETADYSFSVKKAPSLAIEKANLNYLPDEKNTHIIRAFTQSKILNFLAEAWIGDSS